MNFKITKKQINTVMGHISRLFSVTVILPIYHSILLEARENGIIVTVTDGTVSMREFIQDEITVYETGSCAIDGRLFYDIVKKANDTVIWIRQENHQLKFKSGKAEMKLVTIDSEAFPHISFDYPKTRFQIYSRMLSEAINKTIFSANDQQTRPVLGGLNFKVNREKCIITGTDSYRLSQVARPVVSSNEICITIPKKMLGMQTALFNEDEELYVYFDEHKALMANDNIIIQSVLLDGVFPDTELLIPKHFDTEIYFNRMALLEALDRTSFCRDDGITIVTFDLLNDEIVLTTEFKEIGSSIESVSYENVSGNRKVHFSCNQQYMIEALKAFDTQVCVLHFNEDLKPFILRDSQDESHIQLLLPTRRH